MLLRGKLSHVSLLYESTDFVGEDEDIQQINCLVVE